MKLTQKVEDSKNTYVRVNITMKERWQLTGNKNGVAVQVTELKCSHGGMLLKLLLYCCTDLDVTEEKTLVKEAPKLWCEACV